MVEETYSTAVAYFFWLISGCGALGFHRFYLGRIGSGLLYFFTGGLFMVGAIADFFTIPAMVREANLGSGYRRALYEEGPLPRFPKKESIERVILRTAKKNAGIVTPGEVALEGDIGLEEARKNLDKLVTQGYADLKVRKSGVLVYVFPEFLADSSGFEDF